MLRAAMIYRSQPRESEPMEVEVTPPVPEPVEDLPNLPAKIGVTKRDLEDFPALRPPIRSKVVVIPDTGRELPPPKVEEDRSDHRVSSKRKKGAKDPSWGDMEVFSSTRGYPRGPDGQ